MMLEQAAVLQCADHDIQQLGAIEGLEQVVDGAAAEGVGGDVDVVQRGQHDDGHAGVVAADDIEQGEAVDPGHHDVGEDEVAAGVVLQMEQGLFGVGHRGDVVSAVPKHGDQNAAHRGFVVNH